MIKLLNVKKTFLVTDRKRRKTQSITAVNQLTLSVEGGEIYGLLGPNGAGKSTTLRMIAGLIKPDEGTIEICGIDNQKEPEKARAQIGYLSTDINVYGRFTPREFLRLFGELQGVDQTVAERRGMHLLDTLEMTSFADIKMEAFSSGQKQKVGIARALLHDPKVVIFDEPTTGLDVLTAKTVLDLLRVMRQEKRAVIVSTHVMPMVQDVCDRVGIIFNGELYGDASPDALLDMWHVKSLDQVFFNLAAGQHPGTPLSSH